MFNLKAIPFSVL